MFQNFRKVLQEIEQMEHLCVHENLLNLFRNNWIFAEKKTDEKVIQATCSGSCVPSAQPIAFFSL